MGAGGAQRNGEAYRSRAQKLAEARSALSGATNYVEALAALSLADEETVRVIERDFFFLAAPASEVRERIATAWVDQLKIEKARDTELVTASWLGDLAKLTLVEFLSGVTDLDESVSGQYQIAYLGGRRGEERYQVTTLDGFDPRVFRVHVQVELEPRTVAA